MSELIAAKNRAFWMTIAAFVLVSLACNAFAGEPEPVVPPLPNLETAVPTVTSSPPAIAPTATLAGATTPGTNATATPDTPTLTALVDLNVRVGPGVVYDKDGFLLKGETAAISGRDPATGWWRIECPARVSGSVCWVSGQAQYTAVANTDGVPIAEIPPTPTPKPANIGPIAAYIDDGAIKVLPLDTGQSPPAAGEPNRVGSRSDALSLLISPDGSKIAYTAGTFGPEEVRVVNVDGSDDRPLVGINDLPLPDGYDAESFALVIAQIAWLPDSLSLLFNTELVASSGIPQGHQEDLWRVSMRGEVTPVLPAGDGGALFALSPNGNQVILSQSEAILRADLSSGSSETLIQFELVNTASEYIYYPIPQWTADGSSALVAVPSREQFAEDSFANLWQIPATGTAVQLGTLPGNILFNPVVWSANGERLAYVRRLMGGSNIEPVLMLAGTNGQNPGAYNSAEQIEFFGWSQDNVHFLYATDQFYAVGRSGSGPVTMSVPSGMQVRQGQWLNETDFLAAVGTPGGTWTLQSGNVSGTSAQLTAFETSVVTMDVWAP